MRKPYARTHSSKEIDRRTCFETSIKRGSLCANPMRRTRFSTEIDRRICFETTSKKGILCASPYAQTLGGLGAWGPWGLGRRRAWAKPSILHPTSFFPHSSLLPAKRSPYATTHSYVGASGPSSLPPPSSLLPPPSTSQTLCATLCAL